MQESQETHISNHLDEIVAAVSITPRQKIHNKLPQTALFQLPREKLHLCEEKAKSYTSSHNHKQAIHELVRCVALTRICYGDSHWKLAEAHVNLAQGYLQLKGLSLQAKHHAEKAKEILIASIVPPYNDDTDVFRCSVELFHTMGRAFLALQKFKEASENLGKAERLSKELLQCERIIKEEWIEIQARVKLSFGQVYQGQKKSKEALPHYQKALEYLEIGKGEKSLECVPVLRELAGVEQVLGFHDAAINHFLQTTLVEDVGCILHVCSCLQNFLESILNRNNLRNGFSFSSEEQEAHLIIQSRNPSQEEAADSAYFVAHAALASGWSKHHDVAEQYFQESMAHLKDSEGPGRAKFFSIQDEFCQFLQMTGQKERATTILKESLEAKVRAFGDFSPEVAETYQFLSGADVAQGNYSGAHRKLRKCLQIQTLLYGAKDKRTLATKQTVDILSKAPEVAMKPRQAAKAKVAFCTGAPQHTMLGKARPNAAD
uniref:Tetratricopeptide repeat domain 23 n=1 Tax=Otolemur garnettii TaxID=30611 RepID=H0XLF2_OTOGA